MLIDLRQIPILVLSMKEDQRKREFMADQLDARGYQYRFMDGVRCDPKPLGCALSHLKAINTPDLQTPFLVLEDDCQIIDGNWADIYEVPDETDALYLGHSTYGIADEPDQYGLRWGESGVVRYSFRDDEYLRVYNMLGRHAILYLSSRYHASARDAGLRSLVGYDFTIPGDMSYALLQEKMSVLATKEPHCYQHADYGGAQNVTIKSIIGNGVEVNSQGEILKSD